jgi:hypothetical protein
MIVESLASSDNSSLKIPLNGVSVIIPTVNVPPSTVALSFLVATGNDNFFAEVELLELPFELELELELPHAVRVTARTEASVTNPATAAFFIYISSSSTFYHNLDEKWD